MCFLLIDIEVFLFEDLRATPELSFALKHLGCQCGIVLTASHNPPEYNGIKCIGKMADNWFLHLMVKL